MTSGEAMVVVKRNENNRKLYYSHKPHGVQTKLKQTIIGVAANPLILVPHGTIG